MGYFYKFIFLSGFLLFINIAMQAQNLESSYLRGDANVQFRWRFGYSEYPINRSSRTDLEQTDTGMSIPVHKSRSVVSRSVRIQTPNTTMRQPVINTTILPSSDSV